MVQLLFESCIYFNTRRSRCGCNLQRDTGTLSSGEGEDDIDPFEEVEEDKEQLEEIVDCQCT